MTEQADYVQVLGQIDGLRATVKQLQSEDQISWAYIVGKLRKMPLPIDADTVYTLMCGRIHIAQCSKADLTQVRDDIRAAEIALHHVTSTKKAVFGDDLHKGPFGQWFSRNRVVDKLLE